MNVTQQGPNDIVWPLGQSNSNPHYIVGCGDYKRTVKVDPFPCYMPNLDLVAALVAECERAFPLSNAVSELVIIGHDALERINGGTFEDTLWRRPDGTEWKDRVTCSCGCGATKDIGGQAITIVLYAKRIPIHPAMIRYLVAHEYGHAAFNYIRRSKGYDIHEDATLMKEYMAVRGLEWKEQSYRGGMWHLNANEIVANDFRTLVVHRETEFWPHPEVPVATNNSPIAQWWRDAGCSF